MDPILLIPLLTAIGFLLIVLDVLFIPGGLLIAVGALGIGYSIYLTWTHYGVLPALIHGGLSLAAVPKLLTWAMSRVSLKEEMHAEDGFVGVASRARYIGHTGTAVSDLRPAGTVVVEEDGAETRLDCIAEGGYIERGAIVHIFAERGPSLVVRRAR